MKKRMRSFIRQLIPHVQTEDGDKPPLIVGVHGGPTSAARAVLNLKVQFFGQVAALPFLMLITAGLPGGEGNTAIGFIRGWGIVDIEDIENGVRQVIDEGFVAPDRIAIRGGSAGGYSVMACLANSKLFSAGASYYGISDLEMLAQET